MWGWAWLKLKIIKRVDLGCPIIVTLKLRHYILVVIGPRGRVPYYGHLFYFANSDRKSLNFRKLYRRMHQFVRMFETSEDVRTKVSYCRQVSLWAWLNDLLEAFSHHFTMRCPIIVSSSSRHDWSWKVWATISAIIKGSRGWSFARNPNIRHPISPNLELCRGWTLGCPIIVSSCSGRDWMTPWKGLSHDFGWEESRVVSLIPGSASLKLLVGGALLSSVSSTRRIRATVRPARSWRWHLASSVVVAVACRTAGRSVCRWRCRWTLRASWTPRWRPRARCPGGGDGAATCACGGTPGARSDDAPPCVLPDACLCVDCPCASSCCEAPEAGYTLASTRPEKWSQKREKNNNKNTKTLLSVEFKSRRWMRIVYQTVNWNMHKKQEKCLFFHWPIFFFKMSSQNELNSPKHY